jgi:hypothetical protein
VGGYTAVLVDESAECGSSVKPFLGEVINGCRNAHWVVRGALIESLVRAVPVVMAAVFVQDLFQQVAFVGDEGPVKHHGVGCR